MGDYEQIIKPQFVWVALTHEDWKKAGMLWAQARKDDKQLADMDLLIAAITLSLKGVLVSADEDFDALPTQRENWRTLHL